MTTTRLPFVGSGRLQEGGALAVRKQDFNAHVQGTGFRHDATQIDMNPVISLVGGTTVQETLENLRNLIVSAGTGFLSIGSIDGYIQGDYNVGSVQTPTLYDTFNAAFADTRLQNGGLILVLAGTYHLRSTVTVPAGISIMGEIAGTTIIGEMQEVPMFIIQKPNQSIDLVSGIPFATGSNVDSVKFMNMILADNLDGYVLFGEPCMTTTPMIQAQISSNFTCENVSFVGRIHTGATPRSKTQSAIGYTGSGTSGTILKMKDCYLDGLKIGISFIPTNNAADFLTVENCKARIYGTEDAASQSAALNSFIVMSHCNAKIISNYFLGAGTYVNTLINIITGDGVNVRTLIVGNFGNPNSSGALLLDITGTTFTPVISNNNWGTFIENPGVLTRTSQTWTGANIYSGAVSFDNVTITAGNSYKCSSRVVSRCSAISPLFDSASWIPNSKSSLIDQASSGSVAIYPLDVPHAQTVTAVTITIVPQSGHVSLPAVKPKIEFCKIHVNTSTETIISTISDTPLNVAAYELSHNISITGLTELIDNATYSYYLRFISESGANATSGLAVTRSKWTAIRITIGED